MVRNDAVIIDDGFYVRMEWEMHAAPEYCLRERGSAARRGVWSIEFSRNAKKGFDVVDADDLLELIRRNARLDIGT